MQVMIMLYGTAGCHLCEDAKAILQQLNVDAVHVDIAADDGMLEKYGARIPVLKRMDNDVELGWPFDAVGVTRFLS